MFEVIKQGDPVPSKVWRQVTDLLIKFRQAGEAWVSAGRPAEGAVADAHNQAETAYVEATEAIWYGKWSSEQRAEWARLWNVSPYGSQNASEPASAQNKKLKMAL